MRRHSLRPAGEMLVRYTAEEMPTSALVTLQRQTVDDLTRDEIAPKDALRILNLLLTIALRKLEALST